ncbi:MAG: rhodanese-like domain-containing protein [Actinomycetota bacterium]|nr:rhodanese-like domain-containing protein [Actinomycetota bacterium]
MFFRQVLHDDLGCASYVIADGGEAAVIDPKWEIEDYLALADEHAFQIRHILETHNHADHVSGHGRLQQATGATIHISKDADVAYEHEPLADGDTIDIGDVRITAVATPGHRPEHMAYTVQDRSRGKEPWLLATGDSLFVGDLARPDLAVEPEEGARGLYASTRKLLELPDFAEVWPGHIGGSLCGGAGMSEKPLSTIGFERRFNRFLTIVGEQQFVRELTSELAPQPPNFERIVELNKGALLTETAQLEPLAPARVRELLDAGAILIDGRATREFDAAHVRGSLNVTMVKAAVGTRAAWVVDPEADVIVFAAGENDARRLARMLEAVGFRILRGHLAGGIDAWQEAGFDAASTPAIDVPTLAERLKRGEVTLLDVREDDEWKEGHVDGSLHVPYHELRDGAPDEVKAARDGKPLAVACSAGNRSSIAVSLLERDGLANVIHVTDGGVADLEHEGVEFVEAGG